MPLFSQSKFLPVLVEMRECSILFLREDERDFVYLFKFFFIILVNFHLSAIFKFKNELGHGSWVMDPFWATQL